MTTPGLSAPTVVAPTPRPVHRRRPVPSQSRSQWSSRFPADDAWAALATYLLGGDPRRP